ncbi:anti-sigma-V factor rsiV [Bacillaceae bacterium SIJ1]|uniref:DUF3298 and DUF4163 domain-containing protein n=1 Tax=Litoribacterium kuwaitense TaxID=1398745 RepID=UPI0013EDE88B|nr:DUF3298 and DUF4163 domain-containing protein [Litoribacterium kuwaitense]NGP43964.1 anti-sigma-V factor rsiV [Litoribacterium kuwaitense]
MNKKLNELHKIYKHIEVPTKLDETMKGVIQQGHGKRLQYINKRNKKIKMIGTTAAGLFLSVALALNTSAAFAQTLYNIPGVEDIARLITFRDYEFENETSKGSVHSPVVDYEQDKSIENKINEIIQQKLDSVLKEQEQLDAEYKKAFIETGGKESEFRKVETTIDYKIGYSDETILSFEIYKHQTLAPAYNENAYYTFNLETGELLTLKDFLGQDFKTIVTEKVTKEMEERMKTNPEDTYDTHFHEISPIDENHSFYINKEGEIVVTFAKYEVAAGYMGVQEFSVGHIDR